MPKKKRNRFSFHRVLYAEIIWRIFRKIPFAAIIIKKFKIKYYKNLKKTYDFMTISITY